MDLVRDLLDKQVVDRHGREMGRVDGIELERRSGEPPRVTEILIGPSVLGERLHRAIRWFVVALESALGLRGERPIRIAVAHIQQIDRHITIKRTISETSAGEVEKRVRALVTKIPGA